MKKLYIILAIFFLFEVSEAQNLDSLLSLPDSQKKIDELNKYLWEQKYDSVLCHDLAKKIIEISQRINYLSGIATAKKNLAAFYYYRGLYDKALQLYNESLEYYKKANDLKGEAIAYRNIGNVQSQIGNWKAAIEYYIKSLKIREEIKDSIGIALTLNSIGLIYSNFSDYHDSAIVYFSRAQKIFEKQKDYPNLISTYISLCSIFFIFSTTKHNKYLDSIYYYSKKAYKLSQEIGDIRQQASAAEIIGMFFLSKKQNDSTLFYLQESLRLRKITKNQFGIASSLTKLGEFYLKINDFQNSKKYSEEALKICKEQNLPILAVIVYGNLTELYEKTGDYKNALYAYKKFILLKDSLNAQENIKKITQLSMQYEFDKQQKIKELEQQKKDAIKEAIIKRQRLINLLSLIALSLAILAAILIFRSYKHKQKTAKILEEKNRQISVQNVQLNQQKEEILAQRDEIERQKLILEKKNKNITESINYAKRIQNVLLNYKFFDQHFKNYFILYRPRDIVSGDFFWGYKTENKLIIAAADCTGHGVPGAFVSLLGITFLNEIMDRYFRFKSFTAADILNKLRELIITTFTTTPNKNDEVNIEENLQDGMDISLIIFDTNSCSINYAGAYNSLYIVRNNQLNIIEADKMPVGYHFAKLNTPFENKYWNVEPNDKFYLFSDGYADQMGIEGNKKISQGTFKKLITEYSSLPFNEQKEKFEKFLEFWTGNIVPQTDDILLIGLQLI